MAAEHADGLVEIRQGLGADDTVIVHSSRALAAGSQAVAIDLLIKLAGIAPQRD